eukprot:maker-scaffold93_size381549-snap-gene-1.18 protein:Tk04398 transcript:maker-scaffold93_size381549-snap-gene-1.18-mRNA-1 annotation:"apolipoprotein o-like"
MADRSNNPKIMKPVDIPIYGFPSSPSSQVAPQEPGMIQSAFATMRESLKEVTGPLAEVRDQAHHIYQTGVAHTQSSYSQLLDEDNGAARLGVIAAGGLLGYTIGAIRGRFLKKIYYSTLGFGGSAAMCFPQEANTLSRDALEEGRKLGLIGYNFVTGVQPDNSSVEAPILAKEISLLTNEDKKDLDTGKS